MFSASFVIACREASTPGQYSMRLERRGLPATSFFSYSIDVNPLDGVV